MPATARPEDGVSLDAPEIAEVPAVAAAVIHVTCPRAEIRHVMGPAMEELLATLSAQGIVPSGRIFSHHRRMTPDAFDFEVGIPVPRPVTPAGRVTNGTLPAARVVRTTYRGGYEGLPAAWGAFERWVRAQELAVAANLWEVYAVGPDSGDDPARWATELVRPLVA